MRNAYTYSVPPDGLEMDWMLPRSFPIDYVIWPELSYIGGLFLHRFYKLRRFYRIRRLEEKFLPILGYKNHFRIVFIDIRSPLHATPVTQSESKENRPSMLRPFNNFLDLYLKRMEDSIELL